LTAQTGSIRRRSYYAKLCRKVSFAVAKWGAVDSLLEGLRRIIWRVCIRCAGVTPSCKTATTWDSKQRWRGEIRKCVSSRTGSGCCKFHSRI